MKKTMILAALLLGSAAAFAPRGEKVTMGMPHWVADYHSLDLHGAGAPMDWAAWTDAKYGAAGRREIPSGTAVSLSDTGKIIPADGTRRTLLLISNAKEWLPSDSISGYGLAVRGNIYEDQLPDAAGSKLPDAIRAQARDFYLQSLSPFTAPQSQDPHTSDSTITVGNQPDAVVRMPIAAWNDLSRYTYMQVNNGAGYQTDWKTRAARIEGDYAIVELTPDEASHFDAQSWIAVRFSNSNSD